MLPRVVLKKSSVQVVLVWKSAELITMSIGPL